MIRPIAFASAFLLLISSQGMSAQLVTQVGDYAELSKKFCAASPSSEHIFVLPGAIFSKNKEITCDGGVSKLRMAEPGDDPGHVVFNVDPPHGSKEGLDCDGKADVGMAIVAINCFPKSKETTAHPKP